MKIFLILLAGIILGIITERAVIKQNKNVTKADKASVEKVQSDFYTALRAMFEGDAEPMSKVWSHADDVIYMGPDQVVLHGWNKVSAEWEKQAAVKMGGHIAVKDEHIIIGQDIATIYNYEIGENTDEDGKIVKVSIRATNVYRKENNQWKMIAHHTDVLPFLVGK